ncbi:hypothetical protein [Brevundimonas sp.]
MSWLLAEPSDERAVAVIAGSDLLRSEAAMKLPELRQAALRPATHDEIRDIIRTREQTFGDLRVARTEGEWALFFADHFDALEGLTASQVEAGMRAWLADPQATGFSPPPGRLAHLARTTPSAGRWARAHDRARKAVVRSQQDAPAPKSEEPRPSADDMKAMMDDFRARMAAKAPPAPVRRAQRPTPSAVVDETGISAEARALLARQRPLARPALQPAQPSA